MKLGKSLLALVMVIVMVFALTACNNNADPSPSPSDTTSPSASVPENTPDNSTPETGEEVVIVYGVPNSWNQLICMNPSSAYHLEINDKIYDKLIRLNEDGIGEPRAAKSWTMSDDLQTITFDLQDELYWHDGEKVTSADWLFSIQLMTSEYGSQCVTQDKFSAIAGTDGGGKLIPGEELGVEAPDDYTLVINFKSAMNADSFFYNYACMIYVLPEHLLGDLDQADLLNWEFWQAPIGSGPCKFVSENAGTEIVMEAVDNYPIGDLQFDKLIYRVITSDAAASSMLAGEINGYYYGFTADAVAPLVGVDGIRVELKDQVSTFTFLSIDNDKYSKEFRTAVNYAIDKDLIVESLYNGDGAATNSSVRPKSEYCVDSWEGRDVERSKEILDEIGWDYNKVLSLACSPGLRERMAAIIQQNLTDVGIKVEIFTVDTPTVLGGLRDGTYDMGLCNYTSGGNPTWLVAVNLSVAANTVGHIKDPAYDGFRQAVGTATSDEEIAALAAEYQAYAYEEMPYVNIAHQFSWFIFSDWLQNVSAMETAACWEWVCAK